MGIIRIKVLWMRLVCPSHALIICVFFQKNLLDKNFNFGIMKPICLQNLAELYACKFSWEDGSWSNF